MEQNGGAAADKKKEGKGDHGGHCTMIIDDWQAQTSKILAFSHDQRSGIQAERSDARKNFLEIFLNRFFLKVFC